MGNAPMRALMVLPLPVPEPVMLLTRNDTTTDDWNVRCRLDALINWLSTHRVHEETLNNGDGDAGYAAQDE